MCNVSLIGVKTETLISILAVDICDNTVLCTLRLSNILPFVARLKKICQNWVMHMTAFVEMLGKRAVLSKFILSVCFCLRVFFATNEERKLYVKVLLHCSSIVLCEIDFATLQDGIVLDFHFQACKYRNIYPQRHTDQYNTDYLCSWTFPGDSIPCTKCMENAWNTWKIWWNVIK